MTRYMDLLLKIMILVMAWLSIRRIYYMWIINKAGYREPNFIFRNLEGDWTIIFFVLIIINQSRFDKFRLAYQPLLRHFYTIMIGLFIINLVLQLTQFIVITETSLISQEAVINNEDIRQYKVKKTIYGYRFIIDYSNQEKERSLFFNTSTKNKDIIEKRFKELNIKFV